MTTPDFPRARCRTCRAPIIWASSYGGARIPMDADPNAGKFALHMDEHGTVHADMTEAPASGEPRYTSHFATCPDAEQHRRRGSG